MDLSGSIDGFEWEYRWIWMLAPPRHPGMVMMPRISGRDRIGCDRWNNLAHVVSQLVLHFLQDLRDSRLSADVVVLLGVPIDVEQHELGVIPTRLGFGGHSGRGVVPSV